MPKRVVGAQSVERALAILEIIRERKWVSAKDLVNQTGLHRSIIYRLLLVLQNWGYVRADPQGLRYTLGWHLLELADAVIACAKEHALVILQNHGQVTYGRDFNEAIQRAVFFEMICEIILRGGDNLKRLTPEQVASLTNA